jgi:hypothetical protein
VPGSVLTANRGGRQPPAPLKLGILEGRLRQLHLRAQGPLREQWIPLHLRSWV